MVDEKNGVAQIIEECTAKGPVEWDAVNRKRAEGAITDIRVEGTTLIMDTIIGEREVKFGPASKDLGGQGLRSLTVEGDNVRTTWVGLAGSERRASGPACRRVRGPSARSIRTTSRSAGRTGSR